jgi:hypothetical protein
MPVVIKKTDCVVRLQFESEHGVAVHIIILAIGQLVFFMTEKCQFDRIFLGIFPSICISGSLKNSLAANEDWKEWEIYSAYS